MPCLGKYGHDKLPLLMNKLKPILIGIGTFLILSSIGLYIMGSSARKPNAGISVNSEPISTVYINGEMVGQTPYKAELKSGDLIVKLVPQTTDKLLVPYETRVRLSSKIQTIIEYKFGETEESSEGAIISFEKAPGKETSLAVISRPNNVPVFVDGKSVGFSPHKSTLFGPGKHELKVFSPGYTERVMEINLIEGYKLTAVIKLAPTGDVLATPTPTVTEEVKVTVVEIQETPTGYLRIRATPSASGELLAEAKPGERFRYLETDSGTGWYRIEYMDGKEGWVSNLYSRIIEDVLISPTPSITSETN